MKRQLKVILLVALLGTSHVLGQEGTIIFANYSSSRVVWADTGQPVTSGQLVAGMYYSTDLGAVPDPMVGHDGFLLEPSSVMPVAPSASPSIAGRFSSGPISVEDLAQGRLIIVQARVWSVGHASFAEALMDPMAAFGFSNITEPIVLSGGINPPLNTAAYFTGPISVYGYGPAVPEPSSVVLGALSFLGAFFCVPKRRRVHP